MGLYLQGFNVVTADDFDRDELTAGELILQSPNIGTIFDATATSKWMSVRKPRRHSEARFVSWVLQLQLLLVLLLVLHFTVTQ